MTSRYMSSNSLIAPSRVNLDHAAQADREAIHVLGRVVEVEARAVGGGDAELPHQRLAAVVAGADADAVQVEELGDVVRMHLVPCRLDVEAEDAGAALGGRAVERDPRNLPELFERVAGQPVLVGLDRLQ